MALAMLLLGVGLLYQSRRDVGEAAERSAMNLADALDQTISRNLALLDLSLQGAMDGLALPQIAQASPEVRQTAMFDRAATAEYLGSILILDGNGRVRASSTGMNAAARSLDVADRDYFVVHRDQPDAGLFVSRPYTSRLRSSDPSIALSRRLHTADGTFGGVVMCAMRLAYFHHLFHALDLGPNGVVSVTRADGVVLARHPELAGAPPDVSDAAVFQRIGREAAGSFIGRSKLDGEERLYVFRRIAGLPIVLTVGLATRDIYAEWRWRAAGLGSVLFLLSCGTAALCLLFRREVMRRMAGEAAMQVMATTDSLTGLANRRAFEAKLDQEWRRAMRSRTELALLLLDVDHFKAYNDRYGHQAGDAALERLGSVMADNIRTAGDLAARIGGEEFVALLPETGLDGANAIAERIRDALRDEAVPHAGSPDGRVTVSIGVAAMWPCRGGVPMVLMKRADEAMYRAKALGRNRIVASDPADPETGSEPSGRHTVIG